MLVTLAADSEETDTHNVMYSRKANANSLPTGHGNGKANANRLPTHDWNGKANANRLSTSDERERLNLTVYMIANR